jgi:Ca-activated chloride channel family protein
MGAFRFSAPDVLVLLWVLPLLAVFAYRMHRAAHRKRVRFSLLWPELAQVNERLRRLRVVLVLVAIGLVIVALARPSWNAKPIFVHQHARDVVFVVDVSHSMAANDVEPNRLERAKLAILDALPELDGDRVAVVAFAGSTRVVAPLTRDFHFVRWAVNNLTSSTVSRGGSLVGDAIRRVSEDVFDPAVQRGRDLILISDGEDQGSFPVEAASAAGSEGTRIVAVGLGNPDRGSRIPLSDDEGGVSYLRQGGTEIWTRLDEQTLRSVAQSTPGGRYLSARTGAFNLGAIYRDLVQSERGSELGEVEILRQVEQFHWFLIAAVLALVAEGCIRDTSASSRRRRSRRGADSRVSAVLLVFGIVGGLLWLAPGVSALGMAEPLDAGNEAYHDQDYARALEHYEAARGMEPAAPEPLYNLGTVLYEQGNYDAALSAFQSMENAETELSIRSHYNQGNSFARSGRALERQNPVEALTRYEHSVAAYRRVLELDPEHERAARNLEVVRRWIAMTEPRARAQRGQEQGSRDQQQRQGEGAPQNEGQDGNEGQGSEEGQDQGREESRPQGDGDASMEEEGAPEESAESILEEERRRRRDEARRLQSPGGVNTW